MASFAQALVVGRVNKQPPVPAMGLDVVHHRGPGVYAPSGALPAPRLPQELIGPQVVRPDRQAVPAMPLGGGPPLRLYGLVLGAVSIPGQRRASRMPARPERFLCHRAITSGQIENARANDSTRKSGESLALAFDALAFVNIQDDLTAAGPAINRQSVGRSLRSNSQQPVVPSAYWTGNPSILYGKCITSRRFWQHDSLTFFKTCLLFH